MRPPKEGFGLPVASHGMVGHIDLVITGHQSICGYCSTIRKADEMVADNDRISKRGYWRSLSKSQRRTADEIN
jgi:hypothetical protein